MNKHIVPTLTRSKTAGLQSGFSLVELMVAITLGMVLVAGLALLYSNSSLASSELNKSLQQMENGRYAADLLSEDISMAGYYGDVPPGGMHYVPGASCDTSLANMGWDASALTAPVAITGLSATEAAALSCLSNYKAGTPALVIHRLDPTAVAPGVATNGGVYLQTSDCATDPTATPFVFSTSSADFTLKNKDCSAVNTVHRFLTRIYYIAGCDDCGNDSIPTLKRAELNGTGMQVVPLAEGIDDMGFDYAFDTDADGQVDAYQSALIAPPTGTAASNDWANAIGVRLHLLARTTAPSNGYTDPRTYDLGLAGTRGPFTDAFKRKAYVVTARLNNVAGPRELP